MSAKNEQELVLQKESGASEEEKDGGCENGRCLCVPYEVDGGEFGKRENERNGEEP